MELNKNLVSIIIREYLNGTKYIYKTQIDGIAKLLALQVKNADKLTYTERRTHVEKACELYFNYER